MKRKQDHYTRKALKAGYPARSVYKLEEIQQKHSLFRGGMKVLDVGAAPGSWSMWVAKRFDAEILAVDLQEMPELEKLSSAKPVRAVQADVFDTQTQKLIREAGPFDLVMSDAAPSTSGNRGLDASRSAALVEAVMALAADCLKPGGDLVAKLFQGSDEQAILAAARERFAKASYMRPKATRSESIEVFLVARSFDGSRQGQSQ